MRKNIDFTHELRGRISKLYEKSQRNVKKKILKEFETIENIEVIGITGQILKVTGIVHLYGYKVENGGFFDLDNLEYYSIDSKLVMNSEIIETRGTTLIRKK